MSIILSTTTPNSGDGILHITNTEVDENTILSMPNIPGNTLFNSKMFNMIKVLNTYSFQLDGSYTIRRVAHIGGNYPDHYCQIPASSGFNWNNYINGQNVIIGLCYDPVSKYQVLLNGSFNLQIDVGGFYTSCSNRYIGLANANSDSGTIGSVSNCIAFDVSTYFGGLFFGNITSLIFKIYVLDISISSGNLSYNSSGIYSDIELSNAGMKVNGINFSDKMFLSSSILKNSSQYQFSSSGESGFNTDTIGLSYIDKVYSPSANSIRIANDFFPAQFNKNTYITESILSKNSFITKYLYNNYTYKHTLGVEKIIPGIEGYDCQVHQSHYNSVSTITSGQSVSYFGDYVLFCVVYVTESTAPFTVISLNSSMADASYYVGTSSVVVYQNSGYSTLYITKIGDTYSIGFNGTGSYINYTQKCTFFEYKVN